MAGKFGKSMRLLMCATSLISAGEVLAAEPGTPAATPPRWEHYQVREQAPEGAPNVLLIMTDDVGFGASSTFGGIIPTPNLDRLAEDGLRYNRFHTTAMCSPTRAALLTGRNHHAVNSGAIADLSIDRDGYTSVIPDSAATIGDVLGANGYNTGWIGKNHNTPVWENTPIGPYDHWANGMGFDYFYGYHLAYSDQFAPELIENRNQVALEPDADYSLERDFADHAINWLRQQSTFAPDRPFLLYYAPATAHAPLQAPDDWLARFRGKFDEGWDVARETIFAAQKANGTIPESAMLTPRPPEFPAWDSLSPDEKKFAARLMEAYAAMLAYCDFQIGRIFDELERTGEMENTLVIFIQGDNGAATEAMQGALNEMAMFFGHDTYEEDVQADLDLIGTAESSPIMPLGWAWALNAPFQWGKQYASHFGGTRNGMVISWPARIAAHNGVRTQFHHVIDIAPTIYEAAGITPAPVFGGVKQQPIDGVSMVYTFDDPDAEDERGLQYFEMMGNRALYKDGWIAATTPRRVPGLGYVRPDYPWELYHVDEDFSEGNNLAEADPDRLEKMRAEFLKIATANNVLPINDEFLPRFSSKHRPGVFEGRSKVTFYPRDTSFSYAAFPELIVNWTVDATVDLASSRQSVPVITRGDRFAGWGLFIDRGRPLVVYGATHLEKDRVVLEAPDRLDAGEHKVAVSVAKPDKDAPAVLSLSVDGTQVASAPVERIAFPRPATFIGRRSTIGLLRDTDMPFMAQDAVRSVEVTLNQ